MARFVETGKRELEVLELSRGEAAALVRDLTKLLLFSNGDAPRVEVNEKGCRTYQLYFQVDYKKANEPGIAVEEDSDPLLLKGPLET